MIEENLENESVPDRKYMVPFKKKRQVLPPFGGHGSPEWGTGNFDHSSISVMHPPETSCLNVTTAGSVEGKIGALSQKKLSCSRCSVCASPVKNDSVNIPGVPSCKFLKCSISQKFESIPEEESLSFLDVCVPPDVDLPERIISLRKVGAKSKKSNTGSKKGGVAENHVTGRGFGSRRNEADEDVFRFSIDHLESARGANTEDSGEKKIEGITVSDDKSVTALLHRGYLQGKGIGLEEDESKAVKCIEIAAEKGSCEGMYRLACLYRDGRGVSGVDRKRALQLFRKAAALGHEKAKVVMHKIALWYGQPKATPGSGRHVEVSESSSQAPSMSFCDSDDSLPPILDEGQMEMDGVSDSFSESFSSYLHEEKSFSSISFFPESLTRSDGTKLEHVGCGYFLDRMCGKLYFKSTDDCIHDFADRTFLASRFWSYSEFCVSNLPIEECLKFSNSEAFETECQFCEIKERFGGDGVVYCRGFTQDFFDSVLEQGACKCFISGREIEDVAQKQLLLCLFLRRKIELGMKERYPSGVFGNVKKSGGYNEEGGVFACKMITLPLFSDLKQLICFDYGRNESPHVSTARQFISRLGIFIARWSTSSISPIDKFVSSQISQYVLEFLDHKALMSLYASYFVYELMKSLPSSPSVIACKLSGAFSSTISLLSLHLSASCNETLDLSGSNFEGLFPSGVLSFEGMLFVKKLKLGGCSLYRIDEGISKLKMLEVLELNCNQISRIKSLQNLKNLRELKLDTNQISKIEGLSELKNLRELSLSNNQISKIEGLSELKNLKRLELKNNQISKIEGLSELKNLWELHLDANQFSKIEGLSELKNLKRLYLINNQVSKIEGLSELKNLRRLFLESNRISRIEGLRDLSELRDLNFNSNLISKIEGMRNLKNLEKLSLDRNSILKIEGLNELKMLKELHLSWNSICILEGVSGLKMLEKLYLCNNRIAKINRKSKEGLSELKMLKTLDLKSNPISSAELASGLKKGGDSAASSEMSCASQNDVFIAKVEESTPRGYFDGSELPPFLNRAESQTSIKVDVASVPSMIEIPSIGSLFNHWHEPILALSRSNSIKTETPLLKDSSEEDLLFKFMLDSSDVPSGIEDSGSRVGFGISGKLSSIGESSGVVNLIKDRDREVEDASITKSRTDILQEVLEEVDGECSAHLLEVDEEEKESENVDDNADRSCKKLPSPIENKKHLQNGIHISESMDDLCFEDLLIREFEKEGLLTTPPYSCISELTDVHLTHYYGSLGTKLLKNYQRIGGNYFLSKSRGELIYVSRSDNARCIHLFDSEITESQGSHFWCYKEFLCSNFPLKTILSEMKCPGIDGDFWDVFEELQATGRCNCKFFARGNEIVKSNSKKMLFILLFRRRMEIELKECFPQWTYGIRGSSVHSALRPSEILSTRGFDEYQCLFQFPGFRPSFQVVNSARRFYVSFLHLICEIGIPMDIVKNVLMSFLPYRSIFEVFVGNSLLEIENSLPCIQFPFTVPGELLLSLKESSQLSIIGVLSICFLWNETLGDFDLNSEIARKYLNQQSPSLSISPQSHEDDEDIPEGTLAPEMFFKRVLPMCVRKVNHHSLLSNLRDVQFDGMVFLEILQLNNCGIKVIGGLCDLKCLKHLDLSRNLISKIEGLDELNNLELLDLGRNCIEKIENLGELCVLQTLNIANNRVKKIEGLQTLKYLRVLKLNGNGISKFEGLDELHNLLILELGQNDIKKIEGLGSLASLRLLNIDNNGISKIEGLSKLTCLEWLSIKNNRIGKMENFFGLGNLKELYLNNNLIRQVEGLNELIMLEKLELNCDYVSKLEIEGLENLEDHWRILVN